MAAAGAEGRPMNPDRVFGRLDTNGDGKIDAEEQKAAGKLPIAKADLDQDGFITKDELTQAMAAMAARAEKAKPGKGAAKANADRPNRPASPKRLFNAQDIDADGRVSKEEAKGELAEKFAKLDTDKSGDLDLPEVENGLAAQAAADPPKKEK